MPAFCADTSKSVMAYSESGRLSAPTNLFFTNIVQGSNVIIQRLSGGRLQIHGTGGGGGSGIIPPFTNDTFYVYLIHETNAIHINSTNGAITIGTNSQSIWGYAGSPNVEQIVAINDPYSGDANYGGFVFQVGKNPNPLGQIYGYMATNSSVFSISSEGQILSFSSEKHLNSDLPASPEFQLTSSSNTFALVFSPGIKDTGGATSIYVPYIFDSMFPRTNALQPFFSVRNYGDTNELFRIANNAVFPSSAAQYFDGTGHWSTPPVGSSLFQMGTSNATHIPILWGTNLVQLIQGSNTVLYTVATGIVINAVSAADFISSVDPVYFQVLAGQLNLTNANLTNWANLSTNTFTNYAQVGLLTNSIGITVDGGGSPITVGQKGFVQVPYTGVIRGATIMADVNGTVTFDVWRTNSTGFPPTVSGTITASAKPTITGTNWSTTTLTGWITNLTAGDFIGFNVDSASTSTRVTLQLAVSH